MDMTRLNTAMEPAGVSSFREAIGKDPAAAALELRSSSAWEGRRRVRSAVSSFAAGGVEQRRGGRHEVVTDLPLDLRGSGSGPSPLELSLMALTSCVATSIALHADLRGVELDDVRVHASGDIDLRGFLGVAREVRPGFHDVEVRVSVRSALSEAETEAFLRSVIDRVPVLDVFRVGTNLLIEKQPD